MVSRRPSYVGIRAGLKLFAPETQALGVSPVVLHGFWIFPSIINFLIRVMAKVNAAEQSKKLPSISRMIYNIKDGHRVRARKKSTGRNNIIQHLFHPDYILFDWEFFSRELEFE